MTTIVIGLAITAMIIAVAVTITQCIVWYEKKIADWHHKMMTESFADGWDAAVHMMRDE
jgi:multisubunit Na+/H+ antiporter MnhC subunit